MSALPRCWRGQNTRGETVKEYKKSLKRTILWRPFIVDLLDTRLQPGKPVQYTFSFNDDDTASVRAVEVVVNYHLLAEKRRRRIGYDNTAPIAYPIYSKRFTVPE